MKPVACSEHVKIYCPEDGKYSFFNSPYPAHRLYSAIDIYPGKLFGNVSPSPVRGEVIGLRRVRCPEGKDFKSSSHDYVILLRSLKSPERLIKILHLKPLTEIGDIIEPGDDLGTLLRSGFFDFWTEPHVHVEVRKPSDPIRAMGGFKIERLTKLDGSGNEAPKELNVIIIESRKEYSLASMNESFEYGIPANINGQMGFLDAGIPHYRWFGAHISTDQPTLGSTIKLCGTKIGAVRSAHSNMCIAECPNLTLKLKNKPIRLSFYLHPSSDPLIKIVPHKPGGLKLKKCEEVSISIS